MREYLSLLGTLVITVPVMCSGAALGCVLRTAVDAAIGQRLVWLEDIAIFIGLCTMAVGVPVLYEVVFYRCDPQREVMGLSLLLWRVTCGITYFGSAALVARML
ncbi:MAG: hypothetical protein ACK5Q5_10860 [Planctomycetaceae bacterium]